MTADVTYNSESFPSAGADRESFLADDFGPMVSGVVDGARSLASEFTDAVSGHDDPIVKYGGFALGFMSVAIMAPRMINMIMPDSPFIGGLLKTGTVVIGGLLAGGTLATWAKNGGSFVDAFSQTASDMVSWIPGADASEAADPAATDPEATDPATTDPAAADTDPAGVDEDAALDDGAAGAVDGSDPALAVEEPIVDEVETDFGFLPSGEFQAAEISDFSYEDGLTPEAAGTIAYIQRAGEHVDATYTDVADSSFFVIDHGNGVYSQYAANAPSYMMDGMSVDTDTSLAVSADVQIPLDSDIMARELWVRDGEDQLIRVDPQKYDVAELVASEELRNEALQNTIDVAASVEDGASFVSAPYQLPEQSQWISDFSAAAHGVVPSTQQPELAQVQPPLLDETRVSVPGVDLS